MTEEEEDRWWKLIVARVRLEREEGARSGAVNKVMGLALNGDATFMQLLAWEISEKLLREETVTDSERLFAILTLQKLSLNDEAAKLVSGAGRRGRPKNGSKGLAVAMTVIEAVLRQGATNVEDAIAKAAAEFNIGEDMAKKHWMAWGDDAMGLFEMTDDQFKAAIVKNKAG